ncbi:MAG: PIN domain-containing protein [Gemmatimonadales bacterium]
MAYVDTSCAVAIAFGERSAGGIARKLGAFDELVASNLLEAELLATFARERVEPDAAVVSAFAWIIPDRPLHAEVRRVLDAGCVRGAGCWHLATALYVADDPAEMAFLTLDARQAKVARTLGFAG